MEMYRARAWGWEVGVGVGWEGRTCTSDPFSPILGHFSTRYHPHATRREAGSEKLRISEVVHLSLPPPIPVLKSLVA